MRFIPDCKYAKGTTAKSSKVEQITSCCILTATKTPKTSTWKLGGAWSRSKKKQKNKKKLKLEMFQYFPKNVSNRVKKNCGSQAGHREKERQTGEICVT